MRNNDEKPIRVERTALRDIELHGVVIISFYLIRCCLYHSSLDSCNFTTRRIDPMHQHIQSIEHVPSMLCKRIEHFFAHYKDLEDGKWVKIEGWHGVDVAKQEIVDSIACFKRSETNNKN